MHPRKFLPNFLLFLRVAALLMQIYFYRVMRLSVVKSQVGQKDGRIVTQSKGRNIFRHCWDFLQPEFIQTAPSLIAAACICAAIRGLKSPSANEAPRDICILTYCDPVSLELTARLIEQIVDRETQALQTPTKTPESLHPEGADLLDSQPETPTDVQDVEF